MNFSIFEGDALAQMRAVPDKTVQAVVTSPPYFGLRDYGVSGQIGREPTVFQYVQRLVEIFQEVRRVLRDDGTVWCNLGDSYNSSGGHSSVERDGRRNRSARAEVKGSSDDRFKTKDLLGIPWRVAFALQDDGWYLRSDVVWQKKNCMPSSVTDRPTSSHEYIFLLTKSPRYFYDAEAIKEPAIYAENYRKGRGKIKYGAKRKGETAGGFKPNGQESFCSIVSRRNKRSVWTVSTKPCRWEFCGACGRLFVGPERRQIMYTTIMVGLEVTGTGRTCPCGAFNRFVDHFAAFPADLIEPCVLASTSARGCCPKCLAPWRRIVRRKPMVVKPGPRQGEYGSNTTDGLTGTMIEPPSSETIGWEPTCGCAAPEPIPCTVLDPFCGSGTTGAVAVSHGRSFLGVELKPEYARVSRAIVERAAKISTSSTKPT